MFRLLTDVQQDVATLKQRLVSAPTQTIRLPSIVDYPDDVNELKLRRAVLQAMVSWVEAGNSPPTLLTPELVSHVRKHVAARGGILVENDFEQQLLNYIDNIVHNWDVRKKGSGGMEGA